MSAPNDIVFFHYPFSPFSRRVLWYLALREIPYAQCIQPPILPRDDLAALGIKYRRIPLMAIGSDVYCDTRLILRKLEERFPDGALGAQQADQKGIERLLEKWTIDAQVFQRAAQLMPPDLALVNDPKFQEDRKSFMGRPLNPDGLRKGRPEALVHIRDAFNLLETTLLADGRDWILNSSKPSLADIEAIWPFHWLLSMRGAIPASVASDQSHPKVFAWIHRFSQAVDGARKSAPKPVTMKGPDAFAQITSAESREKNAQVDPNDPTGLRQGTMVEFSPIDSGGTHKDRGRLVALNAEEMVLAVATKTGDKEIHLHAPRWGFRIKQAPNSTEAKL